MKILNTSESQLRLALERVNEEFDDNIEFLCIESLNKKQSTFKVRLTVKDSNKAGGRRSTSRTRKDGERVRVHAACWHVHGVFIDELFEIDKECGFFKTVKIRSNGMKIDGKHQNWQDENIGSQLYPCMHSQACDC